MASAESDEPVEEVNQKEIFSRLDDKDRRMQRKKQRNAGLRAKTDDQCASRIKKRASEQKFECVKCNKVYGRADHLKRHQSVHTGERFKCRHCEKTFSRTDHRVRHERAQH